MKKIDVTRTISAVIREVVSREHEGKPVQVVIATRTFETTGEDLWDALTNEERIPRWFLPISGDLRVGGRYQFLGNAGGTITRCEPQRYVSVTWEFGGSVSWVSVRLTPDKKGTCLELEHIQPGGNERWEQFGPGAVGVGWDLGLMGLGEHLATKAMVKKEDAVAWSASEEGKDFVRRSSEDWCRAAIAAGAPATRAKAAAARTTAAYNAEKR